MSDFENDVLDAAKRSVVKLFESGVMMAPDFHNRVQIPSDLAQKVYGLVDYEAVLDALRPKINDIVATKITHALTEELTNDVKKLLSHEPTRTRLRYVLAAELDKIRVE
jgi:hypothetical protein